MTLYEMTEDYKYLLSLAEDPDTDPEVLADTLEAMDGEIEYKADGYAKVIRQLEYDSAALDSEMKRIRNRKTSLDRNIIRMKQALKDSMEAIGKTKFKTELFSFGIQKNKASVVIDDWKLLPPDFLKVQDPVPDKTAIYECLRDGFELNGAHLEQTTSLRIR